MREEVGHHAPAAMNNRLRQFRLPILLALGVIAVTLLGSGSASSAHAPFQRPAVPPSSYVASPPVTWIASTGGSLPCAPGFICYRPSDLRKIYDVPAGIDGSGQTIIIVDAFGSRSLQADLAQFDAENSLPDPPNLTILGNNGHGNQNDPNVQGWSMETTLDVEWAHAFAPGAAIVLSVAGNDNAHSLTKAVEKALPKYPGAIVSQSFGGDETFVRRGFIDEFSAHRVYAGAVALGDSILAATGDWGASGTGDTGIVAWYPATDPLVTAIGGTQGHPWPIGLQNPLGGYGAEETWNESVYGGGATGGAPSQLFPSPVYQQGVSGYAKRTVPDVSLNASSIAGSLIVWQGLHGVVGGTSVSTAEWAGILALANQARGAAGNGPLGQANAALYSVAKNHPDAFHDITSGDNTFDPDFPGFSAGPGYDLTTGLGTPDVGKLVGYLTGVPGAPAPAKLQNVDCQNQQLTGAYKNVHVRDGSWCDLSGATVNGDVRANKASGISVVGTTISGDLTIGKTVGAGDPFHPGLNVICNSAVMGGVDVENSSSSAPFSIGGAGCAASADITGSTASVVGNDFRFNNNAAPGNDVSNNTIFGDLECNRDGGVGGGGNQVGGNIRGQCTGSQLPPS
jgi:subtilase family serine protease